MSNKKHLNDYLSEIEPKELRDLLKELIDLHLEIPKQILTFIKEEHDYEGTINVSGDEQLSLDVAAHELFIQKVSPHLYSLLIGEETTPDNISRGAGEYVILGDFIDGSSVVRSRGPGGILMVTDKSGDIKAALTANYTLFIRFDLATEWGYLQFIFDGNDYYTLQDNLNIEKITKKAVFGFGGKRDEFSSDQKEFVQKVGDKAKLRYGGCLVQDMNNILDETGVFGYFAPKLRLTYEILPFLYLLSKIGGAGYYITDKGESITLKDSPPLIFDKLTEMEYLHRKVGYVGGSKELVDYWKN